jgi:hypothetical protein
MLAQSNRPHYKWVANGLRALNKGETVGRTFPGGTTTMPVKKKAKKKAKKH